MIDRLINTPNNNSFFIFGARGTGKTSLIHQRFANRTDVLFIDLLNDDLFEKYALSPQTLRKEIELMSPPPHWVVLDEVQKIPKLLDVAHQLIESPNKIKFVLTGSSSRKLKQKGVNLLAGRAWIRNLHPITTFELGARFSLHEVLNWGSLPVIFGLDSKQDKAEYLKAYATTYLKTEIQEEQWVRKIEPFRRFLPIAAQMNGKPLNFSSISRDVGVEVPTIQAYYEILEDTLLGFHLPSFDRSIRKQQRKANKFYFFDLGIKKALQKTLSIELRPESYEWGHAFEHWVICEFFRMNDYLQKDFSFSYLLTKDGFEVDLIIERPGKPTAFIEIKSAIRVHAQDFSSLAAFHAELKRKPPGAETYVLSNDTSCRIENGIRFLPWQDGLKEIFGGYTSNISTA